jgi:membrane protein DedA with SNARE-associated domain
LPPIVFLLAAWALALGINFVPAFMPPTWAVLATFHVARPAIPLLALTVGGAAMSAVGRLILALLSRKAGHALPDTDQANAEALGDFLARHSNWSLVIAFGYCLGPFPSNPLFIAAGMGRMRLPTLGLVFFCSRAIADTVWVWAAARASRSLADTFGGIFTSWQPLVLQVVALVAVVLVFRLPWARWLGHGRRRFSRRAGQHVTPAAPESEAGPG